MISSYIGLPPAHHQAIILINAGFSLTGPKLHILNTSKMTAIYSWAQYVYALIVVKQTNF